MEALRRNISVIVGAVLAMVLHVAVAPALSIALFRPNIVFAFATVLAIVRSANASMIGAFALGVFADLIGSHPFGLMTFIMVVISFLLTRVFSVVDNSSLFMVAVSIAASLFLAELMYGFLLIQFGMGVSFVGLLAYRIVPCALYDCIVAFVLYPLVHRFIGPQASATQIPVAQFR